MMTRKTKAAASRWAGHATALFRRMPLFESLTEEELGRVVSIAVPRTYPRGKVVFQEGDDLDYFYVIVQGKLKALRRSSSGKNLTIGVVSSGHTIGDECILDGAGLYVSLETLEPTTVMAVHKDDFLRLVGDKPSVLSRIAQVIARRLKYMQDRMLEFITCSAEQRVTRTIRMLANQFGAVIPLTHQDIGEIAGTTRETASRVIAGLQSDGVVSCLRGSVIVLDEIKT
jgi:CRP/FNR family transcriptional regulator